MPSGDESPHWAGPPTARSETDRPDVTLEMTVVEYEDRPDRCTVYPPGLSSVERTSTWLTADRNAFESLAARR